MAIKNMLGHTLDLLGEAIVSGHYSPGSSIPPETVLFGEISLSGALRPVGQTENRLKEAAKLGFSQAIAPKGSKLGQAEGMNVRQMPDLTAFVGEMFGAG